LERQVEPLVMASEISGLAPLRGYLKLGNLVVPLQVPFIDLPSRHPAFIERPFTSSPPVPLSAAVPAAPDEMPAQRLAPGTLVQSPDRSPSPGPAFFR
jgi:hypothetical protein